MLRKYVCELIASFILVFMGTGAVIVNQETQGVISHAGVAIVWGLVVMSIIYALGNISGAHMNPAVTIGFAIDKRFKLKEVLPYFISQVIGALLASLILKFLFPHNQYLGGTLPAGTAMQSFVLEFILTFFLMLVVINVATGSKETGMFAGMAIGSVVLLEAMFAGPICGASMNPIRSIGPAIVSGHTEYLWIYILAPVGGAAAAIPVCNYLKRSQHNY
ncbi:MAG TPA: aquaporin [Segetibacter sp.]|jgi:aquaporin Z